MDIRGMATPADATDSKGAMTAAGSPHRNVERCIQCGYRLCGLPDAGRCPECGNAYDQSHIVIDGWADGSADPFLAWASRQRLALIGPLLFAACIGTLMSLAFDGAMRWLALLPLAMILGCHAVSRRGVDDVPPIQLILGPQGYLKRVHPAARSAMMLHSGVVALLCAFIPAALFLDSPRTRGFGVAAYLWANLLAVVIYRRKSERRTAARPSSQLPVLEPWEAGHEMTLTPLRPGVRIVRIKAVDRSLRPSRGLLCLEADIPDDRLAHLSSQLTVWPVKVTVVTK